jgi:ADP-dependent NAD(P)H-hydrate dehydratase / NAD(P)H-hydrate epimerase
MGNPKKIFSSLQIKSADHYTIQSEPISSIELMNRAGKECCEWISKRYSTEQTFSIFCGTGNNGGDGLVIGRLLKQIGYDVGVFIIEGITSTFEFEEQKKTYLGLFPGTLNYLNSNDIKISLKYDEVIIDCIFGIGLSRPVEGIFAEVILELNRLGNKVISIDIPSGLFPDRVVQGNNPIVQANYTLTFQFPKLPFFFSENELQVGEVFILNIGLSEEFISKEPSTHFYLEKEYISSLVKHRTKFSHKGNYGHGLLISGSYGKMGACVLAAKSALRSGIGLLTIHGPKCGYEIIQGTVPEAMFEADNNEKNISEIPDFEKYQAIGMGPGVGINPSLVLCLEILLKSKIPLVLDADALNVISENESLKSFLHDRVILTPHVKEFQRLTKSNSKSLNELQIEFSKKYKVFIVLKGANTCITDPEGNSFFNTTGNPGMAKGGSGDCLTGIILSLLAQNCAVLHAAQIGVFIHGLAGDIASSRYGQISMTPSDLIEGLSRAFKRIS